MDQRPIHLTVPAESSFARPVRMLAANLAVLASLSVEATEDLRMAAEEGFVYACSTRPQAVEVDFAVGEGLVSVAFGLGAEPVSDDPSLSYATLLLSALCDSFEVSDGFLRIAKAGEQDG